MYGYTPAEMADMTPYTQKVMLSGDQEPLRFKTPKEYSDWLARRNR